MHVLRPRRASFGQRLHFITTLLKVPRIAGATRTILRPGRTSRSRTASLRTSPRSASRNRTCLRATGRIRTGSRFHIPFGEHTHLSTCTGPELERVPSPSQSPYYLSNHHRRVPLHALKRVGTAPRLHPCTVGLSDTARLHVATARDNLAECAFAVGGAFLADQNGMSESPPPL
jgi:hypothetical protein